LRDLLDDKVVFLECIVKKNQNNLGDVRGIVIFVGKCNITTNV